jgi:hypothetical protein
MRPSRNRPKAEILANAFLTADAWRAAELIASGALTFSVSHATAWLRAAAIEALRSFPQAPLAKRRELVLAIEPLLAAAPGHITSVSSPILAMGPTRWPVPDLPTSGDLAAWLEIDTQQLAWFGDARGLERRAPHEGLRHYRYAWVPKKSGGVRLLEAPKARMKAISVRILHQLLDHVPPHDAAHGFRRRRSVVTHASVHVGSAMVLRIDLRDFFLSITVARVRAIFAALGYPSEVAWMLACLSTNIAPVVRRILPPGSSEEAIAATRHAEQLARTRHLPQGAPTSPALANLVAYGLDVRLRSAALATGARYSRYADDLVFSGDETFARRADSFAKKVETIVRSEGFAVNPSKTHFMRRGARQSVTGVVVNERLTIARRERKRLEAVLYNCVRSGPHVQNLEAHPDFRAHLRGKIANVRAVDPRGAGKLEQLFARIVWAE